MRIATVKFFKECPNGTEKNFCTELIIPSRRRHGAVIREYIERFNEKYFSKIYFYEVLSLKEGEEV